MMHLRNTTQLTLPVEKPESHGYDIYPAHELPAGSIFSDYQTLARRIAGSGKVIIDGYIGVRFDIFREKLDEALRELNIRPVWRSMEEALKSNTEIATLIEPYLGGSDPIFGFRTPLGLRDFFDSDKLRGMRPNQEAELNILIGTGAALSGWDGLLIYIDIPKNEIQFRTRAGSIVNLGATQPTAPKTMYKQFYFVDWIVLNRHKKQLLPQIDILVDGQRESEITWVDGSVLRKGLTDLSCNGFRVRPWFEPGVWGGQWIRNHIGSLPQDVPNYAWSFELIVPENGLIFSSGGRMLEVSFDMLMYQAGSQVVGETCYDRYGDEFPIRMDYLDNFDGGNLSIQCHPQREYIGRNFGEILTQEETYYILDAAPEAKVYLGFKEDIVPDEFRQALETSFRNGTELDVDRYVYSKESSKHELFLIPPGTLHSSGKNNLVLEISTTPYIFTFKMYDWLAVDLDGNPRPLNIPRAMDNLCFDRKGAVVENELVCHPVVLRRGEDWELWHLPTHRDHSYDVHRYKLNTTVEVSTEGKCHVLNLVEGEHAQVTTQSGITYRLHYAETLVISAAAGSYQIQNTSGREIMMVKAFMK